MAKRKANRKFALNDCMYVIEADGDDHLVYKFVKNVNARPDPYRVDHMGVCDCKAGEHGRECRHSKMISRVFRGKDVPWDDAVRLTDQFLKTVTKEFEGASVQALLEFKEPTEDVQLSHCLVHGAMNDTGRERLTVWTEHATDTRGPLLLVLHVFRDKERYERTLRAAKKKGKKLILLCPGGCGQAESLCACDQTESKSDSSGKVKRRRRRR